MDCENESVDLAVLQQSNKAMELKIEDLLQKLFECKRSNATYKSVIQDMESELEILQKTPLTTQPDKNGSKDEEHKFLKNQIEELDNALNDKNKLISEVSDDLKVKKKENDELFIQYNALNNEHHECTKTINSLNMHNHDLTVEIKLMKESLENLAVSSETFTSKIKYLENELKETQEALQSANNTLKETKEALQECQDEKALISNELMSLKSQSKNLERGNSLFSEVDDQRELVTHQFKILKEKYSQLKYKQMKSENELVSLRNEKLKLLQMKDEENKVEYESLLKHYNNCEVRIKELEQMNDILSKRPENPKIEIVDKTCSNLSVIEALIEDARAESRKLREELQAASGKRLFESEKLFKAEHEACKLRRKVYEYETEISVLRQQLIAKADSVSIVEESSINQHQYEDPKRNKVHFAEDAKENDGGKKLVRNLPLQNFPKMFISIGSEPLKESNK